MSNFETNRKTQTISLFEDFLKDSNMEMQSQLGVIMETINVLQDSKEKVSEIKAKD